MALLMIYLFEVNPHTHHIFHPRKVVPVRKGREGHWQDADRRVKS